MELLEEIFFIAASSSLEDLKKTGGTLHQKQNPLKQNWGFWLGLMQLLLVKHISFL